VLRDGVDVAFSRKGTGTVYDLPHGGRLTGMICFAKVAVRARKEQKLFVKTKRNNSSSSKGSSLCDGVGESSPKISLRFTK